MTDRALTGAIKGPESELSRRPGAKSHGWRVYAVAAVVLVLAAVSIASLKLGRGTPVQYTTMALSHGPVVRSVAATGTVNPVLTIIVGTYVSGVIQELYCDYNTQVKKGQLCAKIDPRLYQATVDQDRASLAVA